MKGELFLVYKSKKKTMSMTPVPEELCIHVSYVQILEAYRNTV